MTRLTGRRLTTAWALLLTGAAPKEAEDTKVADPPSEAGEEIAGLRAAMQAMRDHLTKYGTAVGALASAVLAGVGWATFTKFAPLPAGQGWLAVVVALAGITALAGAVNLTRQFFAAQRRIVIDTDTIPATGDSPQNDLNKAEVTAARRPLDELAVAEGAVDVAAVEVRALRMDRAARHHAAVAADAEPGSDAQKAALRQAEALGAEAERLLSALGLAAMWACVQILETRSRTVFSGWKTTTWSLATAAGVLALLLLADYAQGQRDLVDDQTACLTSMKDVPGYGCDSRGIPTPAPTKSPAPAQPEAELEADVALMDRLEQCRTAAEEPDAATALPGSEELVDQAIALCAGLPAPAPPTPDDDEE